MITNQLLAAFLAVAQFPGLLGGTSSSIVISAEPSGAALPVAIDVHKSLLITDLNVVNDPIRTTHLGKWTFGYLMTQIANPAETGISPPDFVLRWLQHWMANQSVNGFTIPARATIQATVIDPWPKLANGKLDLSKSPMRLLAIVNRIDLRDNATFGEGHAGEARFVFGVLDGSANPLQFTVILEYGVSLKNFAEVQQWANDWAQLSTFEFTSPEFVFVLERITERFAKAGIAPVNAPNRSAIRQIRTNEIALDSPWELREFRVDENSGGYMRQVTVKLTPDSSLFNSTALNQYVASNAPMIAEGRHRMPLEVPIGTRFQGGNSLVVNDWVGDGNFLQANFPFERHMFALNTCNGCHGRETNTTFLHVAPRASASEANLSGFLKGTTVSDPVTGDVRVFNDLEARKANLARLINAQSKEAAFQAAPRRQVH
jgi:hypothetical protein